MYFMFEITFGDDFMVFEPLITLFASVLEV